MREWYLLGLGRDWAVADKHVEQSTAQQLIRNALQLVSVDRGD